MDWHKIFRPYTSIIAIVYIVIALQLSNHALNSSRSLLSIDLSLQTVDLIIFSFDRPLQLYALLESIEVHLTGIERTTVIYRSSNEHFNDAYVTVKQRFPAVIFLKQCTQPAYDFKPLILQAVRSGKTPYICFAVDDLVVKLSADLRMATQALCKYNAYGFFLRMGAHLTACYTENQDQPLPSLTPLSDSMLSWTFSDGKCDWNYAHTVDMTIYRKQDLITQLMTMDYANPNRLEGIWARYARAQKNKKGICFADSAVVNIPCNRVQEVCHNRHMNSWSTEQLLEKFNAGLKIDIHSLYGIKNESCHISYPLTFIAR